jgi:hypothetical protein
MTSKPECLGLSAYALSSARLLHLIRYLQSCSPETRNFTQLVWASTTQMGCRRRQCDALSYGLWGFYVVCYYSPKGNVEGAFAENVQARLDESVSSEAGLPTSIVASATSSVETPTSFIEDAPSGSPVGNAAGAASSNATTSGPMRTATSITPTTYNTGAAHEMRGRIAALWTAVMIGCLAVWAV